MFAKLLLIAAASAIKLKDAAGTLTVEDGTMTGGAGPMAGGAGPM
eukprot:CAMPEP_0185575302 /NCGR_PEP_ID=MMETSP0434-20130131/6538_1 /TAXON_ID=626734 ORGANISM="Favella taraikaensis, Strain Fe Narragansett Bay" /NCGR_SAMPLE_ID=MMETSP0434 /ASSEMBLY_ACC=CAM_ASM_000379 /LENGTH=44 /DNA_ID= /DNA_START= /DNA_END= /DNA_ORIENTATION=